jgi:hypothetical protein
MIEITLAQFYDGEMCLLWLETLPYCAYSSVNCQESVRGTKKDSSRISEFRPAELLLTIAGCPLQSQGEFPRRRPKAASQIRVDIRLHLSEGLSHQLIMPSNHG